jgi:2-polyprenyl-6-methoxyphenol hydroxylase-like FAD-dependent oxidoreductase
MYALIRPGRQLLGWTLDSNRFSTTWLYSEPYPIAQRSHETAVRELRHVFGDLGWITPELLERCGQVTVFFDEVFRVEVPNWSAGRVVLIGDACKSVSLLAGTRKSRDMAAGYILAQELNRGYGEINAALARYEQRLSPTGKRRPMAGRQPASPLILIPETGFQVALLNGLLPLACRPVVQSSLKRVDRTRKLNLE